ncbi:hypothetical protein F5887DRAFT_916141 [Amanita rubescens]|nr:hypothetical protein F5887DRAFT_916141 [Amanita rubescens]
MKERLVYVRGTPGSGKSTLLDLLHQHILQKDPKAFVCVTWSWPPRNFPLLREQNLNSHSWLQATIHDFPERTSPAFLLMDEAGVETDRGQTASRIVPRIWPVMTNLTTGGNNGANATYYESNYHPGPRHQLGTLRQCGEIRLLGYFRRARPASTWLCWEPSKLKGGKVNALIEAMPLGSLAVTDTDGRYITFIILEHIEFRPMHAKADGDVHREKDRISESWATTSRHPVPVSSDKDPR